MVDAEGNEIEDKPRWVSENFPLHNLSVELAKSTKRYLALDPDEEYEGNWLDLVGTPCMVTIVNNKSGDKIYDNVANVGAMRAKEARSAPALINDPRIVDLDSTDTETFLAMPDWIREKIASSLEWESTPLAKALGGVKKVKATDTPEEDETPASDVPSRRKRASKPVEEVEDDSIPFDVDDEEENW